MPDRKMVNYAIYSQKVEDACKDFLKDFPVKGKKNPKYRHLRWPQQREKRDADKKIKIKKVCDKHKVSEKLLLTILLQ